MHNPSNCPAPTLTAFTGSWTPRAFRKFDKKAPFGQVQLKTLICLMSDFKGKPLDFAAGGHTFFICCTVHACFIPGSCRAGAHPIPTCQRVHFSVVCEPISPMGPVPYHRLCNTLRARPNQPHSHHLSLSPPPPCTDTQTPQSLPPFQILHCRVYMYST